MQSVYLYPLQASTLNLPNPSAHLRVIIIRDLCPFRAKSRIVKLGLGTNDHPTLTSELEIGSGHTQVNLSDELSRRVPDMHTITTTSIDVSLGVTMDT
jgi:hypothetical protein